MTETTTPNDAERTYSDEAIDVELLKWAGYKHFGGPIESLKWFADHTPALLAIIRQLRRDLRAAHNRADALLEDNDRLNKSPDFDEIQRLRGEAIVYEKEVRRLRAALETANEDRLAPGEPISTQNIELHITPGVGGESAMFADDPETNQFFSDLRAT